MPDIDTVFYDPNKTFDDNFDNGPFLKTDFLSDTKKEQKKTYNFLGNELNSPFGIPAGPLPSSKHVKLAFSLGFDVVCYKTQRSVPFQSNEFPNITYLDVDDDLTTEKLKNPIVGRLKQNKDANKLTITNSFGNPSRGPEFWAADMKKALDSAGEGQLLIASVVGTIQEGFSQADYFDDFAKTAALAVSSGVRAIEINLSCPNVANEGVICYNPDNVIDICRRVKDKIGDVPLIAKVGYFTQEQQQLIEKIVVETAPYLQAISAINTLVATVVDEEAINTLLNTRL
jgi:dihydroorotate dehydrogenase (NAD+) catalytic subunit